MEMIGPIPSPRSDDDEDVHWALSTANALWGRGEQAEALKWLRRAAEQASDADANSRALELFKAAAEVAGEISPSASPLQAAPGVPLASTAPAAAPASAPQAPPLAAASAPRATAGPGPSAPPTASPTTPRASSAARATATAAPSVPCVARSRPPALPTASASAPLPPAPQTRTPQRAGASGPNVPVPRLEAKDRASPAPGLYASKNRRASPEKTSPGSVGARAPAAIRAALNHAPAAVPSAPPPTHETGAYAIDDEETHEHEEAFSTVISAGSMTGARVPPALLRMTGADDGEEATRVLRRNADRHADTEQAHQGQGCANPPLPADHPLPVPASSLAVESVAALDEVSPPDVPPPAESQIHPVAGTLSVCANPTAVAHPVLGTSAPAAGARHAAADGHRFASLRAIRVAVLANDMGEARLIPLDTEGEAPPGAALAVLVPLTSADSEAIARLFGAIG